MESSTRLIIPETVVFEIVEGEAVLLELESGTYFSLNKTGTVAWQLINEHGRLEDVKQGMRERFSAPEERIDKDAEVLVERLVEKGLLVEEPRSSD